MDSAPTYDPESFDPEESDDIIGIAKALVNGHHPGILSTINEQGKPEARWMSSLDFDEFPVFYSLTRPDSRKIAQIRLHPDVNWMFFNADKSLILNLVGKARVIVEPKMLKKIWKQVRDKEHTYFLDQYAAGLGFVGIETKVSTIECTSPKSALRFSIEPAELTVDDCSFP